MLITGGTGSLGNALTARLLETDVDTIRILSRNELKQVTMNEKFDDPRLRFFIGDIRDSERLKRSMEDVDIVIHAAALKHVSVAEYNPFEAVKTNVQGAQNVVECCLNADVEMALAIGTDKAVSPFNTYGATKLLMERLFISANYYKGNHKTKFFCIRYGNVMGSSGSIIPKFSKLIRNNQPVPITDPNMTRFNISMRQALDLIFRSIQNAEGGEVFVPKLSAYRVDDLKEALFQILGKNTGTVSLQVRPGEKYHESLISNEEMRNTFENDVDYVIIEKQIQNLHKNSFNNLKITTRTDEYSSNKVDLIPINDLKQILIDEKLI